MRLYSVYGDSPRPVLAHNARDARRKYRKYFKGGGGFVIGVAPSHDRQACERLRQALVARLSRA